MTVTEDKTPSTLSSEIICSHCSKTHKRTGNRLPRGWKREAGDTLCKECVKAAYILRAVSIPVASPIEWTQVKGTAAAPLPLAENGISKVPDETSRRWQDFRAALKPMWRNTTQASNWIMTRLYTLDVRRQPGQEKIPPMTHTDLYRETCDTFPELPPQTVTSLIQSTTRKYRAKRSEVVWTFAASLPSFRYPTPFPVHNQSWSVERDKDQRIVIARIGNRHYRLALRGGARFARQTGIIDKVIAGTALPGELAIMERGKDIVLKIVAYVPRTARKEELTDTLFVRSTPDSLLEALNVKDEKLWTYNADHLVRWQAEHARKLARLGNDQKFEQRQVPSFVEYRKTMVERQKARLHTAIQQIAASLVGYAHRRRFATVQYNNGDHSFCEKFPWFALQAQIAMNCDAAGIGFVVASAPAVHKSQEPPEKE